MGHAKLYSADIKLSNITSENEADLTQAVNLKISDLAEDKHMILAVEYYTLKDIVATPIYVAHIYYKKQEFK